MADAIVTHTYSGGARRSKGIVERLQIAFTSSTAGDATFATGLLQGEILRITTKPGTPAPSVDWDLTIIDDTGIDVLGDAGIDRHTSNTETIPTIGASSSNPWVVEGKTTITVANAGAEKTGAISIFFRR